MKFLVAGTLYFSGPGVIRWIECATTGKRVDVNQAVSSGNTIIIDLSAFAPKDDTTQGSV